jgi:4-diphosphocytidyl-2-C-methyl-D-erythritol kinase
MRNPTKVFVQAPAKVNLSLKVGALQPDGFHPVETVYQAVNLYDDVIASAADSLSLTVEGEGAEAAGSGPSNLAWRAAVLLAESAGIEPDVHLHLRKRIPVAGGMAGGSADAAGALIACDALWNLGTPREELLALAAQLGSDIPFSVVGGTAIGRGRGDEITALIARGDFHWVFALNEDGLSTPAVYREFDSEAEQTQHPEVDQDLLAAIAAGDVKAASVLFTNDLQASAIRLKPQLGIVLQIGEDLGAQASLVSGSGPTCAFLAKSEDHAIDLAIELQASGFVQRTVRASGPVKGAHVVSVEY